MSDELNEEELENELQIWPRETQPDFIVIISPDDPFRIMREWERNKRPEGKHSASATIKRLQELVRTKELLRAVGTEIAAKMLVEGASKVSLPADLVVTLIRNLFS